MPRLHGIPPQNSSPDLFKRCPSSVEQEEDTATACTAGAYPWVTDIGPTLTPTTN